MKAHDGHLRSERPSVTFGAKAPRFLGTQGRLYRRGTVGDMEIKPTYLGTMISLATVAFGLIAAGAWNKFITDLIAIFLKPGTGVWAELIYAIIITMIAIFVVQGLGKLAERDFGPRTAVIVEQVEKK